MSMRERGKYWIQQNCPNFILQPVMRWRMQRAFARAAQAKPKEVFTEIFKTHGWGGDSLSGGGSDLQRTRVIRAELPKLIERLGVRTFLDVPCGDFHWMREVDLKDCQYIGGDIVPELVAEDQRRYGNEQRSFRELDLTRDPVPAADLILVRDCFIHLSFENIWAAIRNIKRSGSKHILTTTYPDKRRHWDVVTGGFRSINLRLPPFRFPQPIEMILEEPEMDIRQDKYADRSLGLWCVTDLPG
jgi:hypothetical protein